jgi:serine/threonine protein kinase
VLSEGTRIGPFRIQKWINEGACGQSYQGEKREGENKGEHRFVKLLPRELSERTGFSEFFNQECQALEQLQGPGICNLKSFGIMKWKHWLAYSWIEGERIEVPLEGDETGEVFLHSLDQWMKEKPEGIGPKDLLNIMTDVHCGLDRSHKYGVIHGNLKPSNLLIQKDAESFKAWIAELGLYKLQNFASMNPEGDANVTYTSQSLQAQESLALSAQFRPENARLGEQAEEFWDIEALGKIVLWVIDQSQFAVDEWREWREWAGKSINRAFPTVAHSMEALPGMIDVESFGVKVDEHTEEPGPSAAEIKLLREKEWKKQQLSSSLKFKRGMTGLAGVICLMSFLCSQVYLFFYPSPWTEYSLDGVLDRYQLGLGLRSGQAWGIVPGAYDEDGPGGQDVVGEWERTDGMIKLSFRRFKKLDDEESGKKLWQFIGKGATSEDDYHNWQDYLKFDPVEGTLSLIKRTDDREVYLPGKQGDQAPRLYPEMRIRRSVGKITPAELIFKKTDESGSAWSLFFGVGFLLACWIYHREFRKIPKE